MLALLLMAQAASPDIQFGARIEARSVTIEKKGEAKLEVRADPDGGSLVKVEAPKANGSKTLRNVRIEIDAEARIADPAAAAATPVAEPR